MTGIATLTGRFSVAVGTIREASNVIPCIVLLLLAVNPPSPEVVHDRAPVPPGRASWYDHIDTNWPMMFRIASACHSPASRPAPSVQARKGAGRGKNPFLFAMLFEKNIESFSERQPVGVMSFLLLPPAFPRVDAWGGPGSGELAGGRDTQRYG